MELVQKALEFENRKLSLKTFNDRIIASKELKALILGINEFYKKSKDPELMELMKRLTVIKKRVEKRLNYKITV
jgi:hypothetical protein